uniref:Conserved secreted protein n=1 Tax=Heterorhabditis bacteriophora TaxID=37862 RepID=A0A1I7XU02_HETBA
MFSVVFLAISVAFVALVRELSREVVLPASVKFFAVIVQRRRDVVKEIHTCSDSPTKPPEVPPELQQYPLLQVPTEQGFELEHEENVQTRPLGLLPKKEKLSKV